MSEPTWQDAGQITNGKVIATLNRKDMGNGNIFHSIRIARRDKNGKLTQYLRIDDLDGLGKLADDVRHWIQADIDEQRKAAAKA